MTTPAKLVQHLLTKFATKSRWCTGTYALNEVSQGAHPTSRSARQWCISGAIEAAEFPKETKSAVEEVLRKISKMPLPVYNDSLDWKGLQRWLLEAKRRVGP